MRHAAVLILAAGIATAQTAERKPFDPQMPPSVPSASGTLTESATMRYIDTRIGSGAVAAPGMEYTVHYTGWLRDGTKFDSSIGKEPLKFVQGRRLVIAGWEMGFEGMHVGGTRRLFIPYQLAYGEQGRRSIPPKAELIFDVELLAVKEVAPVPAAADLLLPFDDLRDKVIALAEAFPEEKYGWRPTTGVRSFQEVLMHIALANRMMLKIASGESMDLTKRQLEETSPTEKTPVSREVLLGRLRESFQEVRQVLESARPGNLAREVSFLGAATTQRAVLASIDTHIAEHLGQAITYAQMNGILLPWTQ
jgi:uncharacterized damage-inducible protein DinB